MNPAFISIYLYATGRLLIDLFEVDSAHISTLFVSDHMMQVNVFLLLIVLIIL